MEIPAVGFGCYNAKEGDNYIIIKDAIKSGYRFFDTASVYETEDELGRALKDSGLPREDFFIQSKFWLDEMGYEGVKEAADRALSKLKTDYIDVYLMHWPRQTPICEGAPGHPEVVPGKRVYECNPDYKTLDLECYRALEDLVKEGKIKAIGLSNFLPHHLQNILDNCTIKPVVDQLEFHVGYTQLYAINFAKENGIQVEAWSPFARGDIFKDEFLKELAGKYNVSVGQLCLRFICQSGVIPLPKSTTPERQRMNLDIFDFEISTEDYHILSSMVPCYWQHEHPDFVIPGRGTKH